MIRRTLGSVLVSATVMLAIAACDSPEEARAPDATTANLLSATQAPPRNSGLPAGPTRPMSLDELGYTLGEADAPVRIIEFSDFGCGYCRQFHQEIWPTLEQEYVETGKVQWKYVPMILGIFPNAMDAAQAGECAAEQGQFRPMQDRLFAEQSAWKGSDQAEEVLVTMATELGLDVPRWTGCIRNGIRDDRIAAGTQLSQQAGVRGTPTFFVVGYAPIPGALPLELFREVLDTAYAAAVRGDGPGGD